MKTFNGRLFALLFIMIVFLGLNGSQIKTLWAITPPEECEGSREEWEEQIRNLETTISNRRRNLRVSRKAHAGSQLGSSGLPSGTHPGNTPIMNTMADPDFNNMTREQKMAAMDAATLAELQYQVDPWRATHEPGGNSLWANQKFAHERTALRGDIAVIRQYIERCFEGAYFETNYPGHSVIAWNCTGLDGEWNFEIEISNESGDFTGYGSFTLPPAPESGSWQTPAFSYTMDGTRIDEDTYYEMIVYKTDVVLEFTIYGEDNISVSLINETCKAEFIIHTPDPPYTIEYSIDGFSPGGFLGGQVIMGESAKCN